MVALLDANGGAPALEFIAGLDRTALARYGASFSRMAECGKVPGDRFHALDKDKSSKEVKGLGEYRDITSKTRILAFQHGRVSVLLFGFQKKEDKLPEAVIERARQARNEYLTKLGPARDVR